MRRSGKALKRDALLRWTNAQVPKVKAGDVRVKQQAGENEIEFWFEFASNYSYLSVMRIEKLAQNYGVRVSWQPFLLGPIFQSFGWNNSPFILQKEKGEYVWKDMARQCRKYGLPWKVPSQFPRLSVLAQRVMLVAASTPWEAEFARLVMLLRMRSNLQRHDEPMRKAALKPWPN